MSVELKITIQEVLDLREALINSERRIKQLMALEHKEWHKLFNFYIHSV
jgi:hypothetical protein